MGKLITSGSACYRITEIVVSEEEVRDQIKLLKTNKAYGCDMISPHLLKINSNNLVVSLCKIYNSSLELCIFPDSWKKALVLPLHKKRFIEFNT